VYPRAEVVLEAGAVEVLDPGATGTGNRIRVTGHVVVTSWFAVREIALPGCAACGQQARVDEKERRGLHRIARMKERKRGPAVG